MTSHPAVPANPNALDVDRLDLRVAAGFAVLAIALIAPFIANALQPIATQGLQDSLSTLDSEVREAAAVVATRDARTANMYAALLDDLSGSASDDASTLRHRAVEPSVRALRDRAADLGERFARVAADGALTYDDPAAAARARTALDSLLRDVSALAAAAS